MNSWALNFLTSLRSKSSVISSATWRWLGTSCRYIAAQRPDFAACYVVFAIDASLVARLTEPNMTRSAADWLVIWRSGRTYPRAIPACLTRNNVPVCKMQCCKSGRGSSVVLCPATFSQDDSRGVQGSEELRWAKAQQSCRFLAPGAT
jgi:hypothetical protein